MSRRAEAMPPKSFLANLAACMAHIHTKHSGQAGADRTSVCRAVAPTAAALETPTFLKLAAFDLVGRAFLDALGPNGFLSCSIADTDELVAALNEKRTAAPR